jgi:hypothetical protein
MRTRSILKFALVGILLTSLAIPSAMAESYEYPISSQIITGHVASWLVNTYESITGYQGQSLGGYVNAFHNYDSGAGPVDLYRLASTDPASGLNPSLSGQPYNIGLEPADQYHSGVFTTDDSVTVSSSASGSYTMSTSHYYYPRNYPGTVWYPSTGATKGFTV